ncbi:MAG: BlaI/MecI/CopY family transcriptional regulator [Lachnospiraceae bacterium]
MARISDAEWILLDLLWKHGELTITQMVKLLEETKGWSKHAIISFLNKMETKHLVCCHQETRAKVYSAAVEREETVVNESVSFIDKVFHGKLGLMVSNLVENDKLNENEIDELMSILEEKKHTNEH